MFGRLASLVTLALTSCAPTPAPAPDIAANFLPTAWAEACEDWDEWDKPGPPFRIFGNSYYVGTCGIAAILVTSSEGHVLIDSGTEAGADIVARNIGLLGFDVGDVEYLLTSHEHFDHVGGMAKLKAMTGARLVTSAEAARAIALGEVQRDDPQFGVTDPVAPTSVDRVITDGAVVQVGDVALTAIATPGHTPGAFTWTWESWDGDIATFIVYADSLSPISADGYHFSEHPGYVDAYRHGISRLAAIDRCLLVTPHPSASGIRARLRPFGLSAAGRHDCADYAASIEARLDARLAEEAGE